MKTNHLDSSVDHRGFSTSKEGRGDTGIFMMMIPLALMVMAIIGFNMYIFSLSEEGGE